MTCATETRSPLPAASRQAGETRQHHAGLVMLALAMGGFAIGTTEFAVMSLVPYFSVGLGIDEPTAGHVISAYALGVVVGAPVIAVLAAKIPRRTLLIGLMAVFGVANLLSALAPSYEWMLVFRFLSGLPHGAYFGVAALVAASIAPPNRRAQAVARVMLGLTVATIVGVPLANGIGQILGWRWGFGIVALLALLTMALIFAYAPRDRVVPGASPLRELGALRSRQVWLTLAIGAIGFGGMFAVYTYLASTLMEVTRVSPALVPLVLGIFGLGLTAGTLAGAWAADRALMPSIGGMLLWTAAALALFPFAAGNIWTISIVVFLIGTSGGLGAMLQTRLMDVAGEAQTLAAALNHSAFNTANALGPWLGGLAIAAGYGWTSTGWVGTGLALAGFLIWVVALLDQRARAAR
ncbi:MAG: MFS transporter [Bosea sp. (in: a-proteobacteria)]|uniref:MFS transporter n=1 Tax=Bosea sp. (in: a-proteobacteria) TaxID=1871050 RepID=UPI0027369717|nr:MFS transporter [Bosea sp. (in: a-proteobacteria)]MDP3602660.1 MFS transporter [Bosea sp. (in: a-proteobacteria)]